MRRCARQLDAPLAGLRQSTHIRGAGMEFGIFDHVDASGAPLQEFYDNRFKIVEAYDRGGFYCYHVAEHHQTPLGLAASPAVYLAGVAQRTKTLRFGPL